MHGDTFLDDHRWIWVFGIHGGDSHGTHLGYRPSRNNNQLLIFSFRFVGVAPLQFHLKLCSVKQQTFLELHSLVVMANIEQVIHFTITVFGV